ncbi:MAG: hypothetical protein AAF299_12790 [Pseudomonadota bacterium]
MCCSFVASVSTAMLCLVTSSITAEADCVPAGNDEEQNIVCQDDTDGAPFDAGYGQGRVVIKEVKYDDAISGGKGDDTISAHVKQ